MKGRRNLKKRKGNWLVLFSWSGVPAKWKVTGLIPCQGTCLGGRFSSCSGAHGRGSQPCLSLTSMFLSLSFFLPFSLSKNKYINNLKKNKNRKVGREGKRKWKMAKSQNNAIKELWSSKTNLVRYITKATHKILYQT